VTPEQAIALLTVPEWPPPVAAQWPRRVNRKQGEEWPVGMLVQGIIESRSTLKHSASTPGAKANQPYPVLYLRRLRMVDGQREWGPDGARVLFHGMHTAVEEDLPAMMPLPGLMLTAVFRGYDGPNEFVNIKCLVTTYGGPILPWMDEALRAPIEQPGQRPAAQQARQAGGRPTEAPPRPAPEAGEPSPSPASGSNQRTEDFEIELPRITNADQAKAYIKTQSEAWRRDFERQADAAKRDRSLAHLPPLQMWLALITRTWTAQGVVARAHGEAA
jgi:hypothetical protein